MTVTTDLLKKRKQILKNLGGLPNPTVRNKEWLYLLEEETRNSIMIEGYFADKKEIKNVISNKKETENSQAILGYFDAASMLYEFGYQKYINNEKINLKHSDIKAIHSLMFRNFQNIKLGIYRSGDIHINKASIQPPLGNMVIEVMDYFLDFVEKLKFDNENIISSLAKTHTLFESIHPFEDGNGRVGRILLNYILLSKGYPNIIIKGIKNQRDKYIRGLENAEKGLYKYFPDNIPDMKWIENGDFSVIEEIIRQNLFESIDRLILSSYKDEELISVTELMKQKGFSQSYGRQLVNRGKLVAKKIGKEWYSNKKLLLDM